MIPAPLQKKILLLLIALWVVIFGVMYLGGSKDGKGAPAAERKGPPAKAAPAKAQGELDLLTWNRIQEPLEEGPHNPFGRMANYDEPPPPKVTKVKAPPPPDPYMEELKTFKYFGFALDEKKRVAFVGKGNQSYTVKEKDIIEDKFMVKKITEEYVVLGEPQGPKEMTIAQGGFGEAGPGAGRPGMPGFGAAPTFVRPPVTTPPTVTPPRTMPPKATSPTAPTTPPLPGGRGPRGTGFPGKSPYLKGGATP